MTQAASLSWLDDYFATDRPTLTEAGTGTLNNVASITTSPVQRAGSIRFTGVAPTVTGVADGASVGRPRRMAVLAVGGPLILANESASSLSENRIVTGTGANVTIAQGGAAFLVYDDASFRWRLSGGSGGGGSPGGTDGKVQYRVNATTFGGIANTSSDGTSLGVRDDSFYLYDSGDATKVAYFQLNGITTGTTRTYTLPNASDTLAVLGLAQTFSARQTFSGGISGSGTVASAGEMRVAGGFNIVSNVGGVNRPVLEATTGAIIIFGGFAVNECGGIYNRINSGDWRVQNDGANQLIVSGSKIQTGAPVGGDSSGSLPFRWLVASITKSDATDLTLSAAQYECPQIEIGGTPGGAFNIIAPAQAGAVFCVVNSTASACTFKKSGGTGVTIAANSTAWVRYSTAATDYKRSTADVVH